MVRWTRSRPLLRSDDPRLLRRFTIGLVASALILVAGIVLAGLELSRSNWVHVDAVVVEVATNTSGARTSYRPTVAFEVGGDRHTVTAWSWTPDGVVVGQSLAARYDPADPAHATTGVVVAGVALPPSGGHGLSGLLSCRSLVAVCHLERDGADLAECGAAGSTPSTPPVPAQQTSTCLPPPGRSAKKGGNFYCFL